MDRTILYWLLSGNVITFDHVFTVRLNSLEIFEKIAQIFSGNQK